MAKESLPEAAALGGGGGVSLGIDVEPLEVTAEVVGARVVRRGHVIGVGILLSPVELR